MQHESVEKIPRDCQQVFCVCFFYINLLVHPHAAYETTILRSVQMFRFHTFFVEVITIVSHYTYSIICNHIKEIK